MTFEVRPRDSTWLHADERFVRVPSTGEPLCAACGCAAETMWQVLQVVGSEEHFPPAAVPMVALERVVFGYFPLCPSCLLQCHTCRAPVPTPMLEQLMEQLQQSTSASLFSLVWTSGLCQNSDHDRPALEVDLARPEPSVVIPRWSGTCKRIGTLGIGDRVTVDEGGKPSLFTIEPGEFGMAEREVAGTFPHVGTLVELWSCRGSGGVLATVRFDDGTWTRTCVRSVRRIDDEATA